MPAGKVRNAIGFVVMAAAVAAAYMLTRPRAEESGVVRGSGTIEATEVLLGPRMGGRLA